MSLSLTKVESMSFPRSGHSYTAVLLQSYFGPEFKYQGFHPGTIGGWSPGYHFLKNHDFGLVHPIQTDRQYLVQVRDPFDAMQSWYEMTVAQDGIPATREQHMRIMNASIDYWAAFVRKWVIPEIPNRLIVKYEDLLNDPHRTLSRIVCLFGVVPDAKQIDRTLKENPQRQRRQPLHYLDSCPPTTQ